MNDPGGTLGIGLVAHDEKKADLLAWAQDHRAALARHRPPEPIDEKALMAELDGLLSP